MIVRWSGKVTAGTVSDTPTVHYDLFPSLVELAGAKPAKTDGLSLVGEWIGDVNQAKKLASRKFLFWQTPGACAVRSGDWKIVRTDRWLPWELYDLANDPAEANNLADEHRDQVYRLSRYAKSAWKSERDNDPVGPRTSVNDYVR